jgi:hypothetical protein
MLWIHKYRVETEHPTGCLEGVDCLNAIYHRRFEDRMFDFYAESGEICPDDHLVPALASRSEGDFTSVIKGFSEQSQTLKTLVSKSFNGFTVRLNPIFPGSPTRGTFEKKRALKKKSIFVLDF